MSAVAARHRAFTLLGLLLATATTAALVRADVVVPPWVQEGDLPPPPWARSVSPKAGEHQEAKPMTLFAGPTRAAEARGVTIAGTPLPFFGEKRGSGCSGRWWLVGPLAWVCSDDAELSRAVISQALTPQDEGLSVQYFFVSRDDGTSAYTTLESAVEGVSDHELEGGWAVGIAEQRVADGKRWGRTSKGLWLAMQDLAPAHPSSFHGETVGDGLLDFAWVLSDQAGVWSEPTGRTRPIEKRARFERVAVREDASSAHTGAGDAGAVGGDPMVRLDDHRWMLARDLARPTLSPAPAEVTLPEEHWIDVNLEAQTLVAYEGARPVYATLVSTGRGPSGSDSATPVGVHRIWVKLLESDMDNVDRDDVESHYSMEDVPYVQYFEHAVALHGTYWHRDFGRVKSHGCVNLAPLDARWLFAFTEPHVPRGWAAVYPTPFDPGSVVRVR